jgi:2-keto-4-pentenoate hydratase/2-oxohepta-3-ene-1,7-dioic acid hydratase in catechol pathway
MARLRRRSGRRMKIGRYLDGEAAIWGVIDSEAGTMRPLAGSFLDWAPTLTANPNTTELSYAGEPRPLGRVRLLAPVDPAATIVAIGANYRSHLDELGLPMPTRPIAFLMPTRSIIGPDEAIAYPELTNQLDYEVELVAVVGAPRLDRARPLACVLGYTVGNDVSCRDLQFNAPIPGMDLYSGKAMPGATSVGPWITTTDELATGLPDLELSLTVNGERRQLDRTSSMEWNVDVLLEYVDTRSGIRCGDVVFTGTPAGIGHATGRYLQPGDVVEATIETIGTLCNTVGTRT